MAAAELSPRPAVWPQASDRGFRGSVFDVCLERALWRAGGRTIASCYQPRDADEHDSWLVQRVGGDRNNTSSTLTQRVILSEVEAEEHNKSSCVRLGLFTVKRCYQSSRHYFPYFFPRSRAERGRARGIKGNGFIALLHPEKMKTSLTPAAESRNETHNSL